jgi:hypothetical protein
VTKSGRRTGGWKAYGAAALAAGALLAAPAEARASAGENAFAALVIVGGVATVGADIAFAAHDFESADRNKLDRDEWLYAESIVGGAQSALFNTLILGFNTGKEPIDGAIASYALTFPSSLVTMFTVHGIWGLTDTASADATLGVSALVGFNVALTSAAIGRTVTGRLHPRHQGVFEAIVATPGTAIGIYESTFQRPQQGAWIALTAWSGALLLHGVASAVVDGGKREEPEPPPQPVYRPQLEPQPVRPEKPVLQKAVRAWWEPATIAVTPSVLSDGVAQMPGVVAVGTF